MTKTKRQLRAEAVERLNDMVLDTGSAVKKLAIALDVKWNPDNAPISMSKLQNRLRDLLTDDDANDDSAPENGVSADDVDSNDANATQDTREKLEADVRKHYSHTVTTLMYPPSANKVTDMLTALPVDTVIGWLDRQAAITERELCKQQETLAQRMIIDGYEFELFEMRKQISELQIQLEAMSDVANDYRYKRDELQEQVDTLTSYIHDIKQIARKV